MLLFMLFDVGNIILFGSAGLIGALIVFFILSEYNTHLSDRTGITILPKLFTLDHMHHEYQHHRFDAPHLHIISKDERITLKHGPSTRQGQTLAEFRTTDDRNWAYIGEGPDRKMYLTGFNHEKNGKYNVYSDELEDVNLKRSFAKEISHHVQRREHK